MARMRGGDTGKLQYDMGDSGMTGVLAQASAKRASGAHTTHVTAAALIHRMSFYRPLAYRGEQVSS